MVVQTATTPTFAARTITGTTDQITVTNGDGVSANPTISLPSNVKISGNFYGATDDPVMLMGTSRTATSTGTSTTEFGRLVAQSTDWTAGSIIRIVMWGFYGVTSGTPTLQFRLRRGTTAGTEIILLELPTTASQSNSVSNPWHVEYVVNYLTTTAIGAVGIVRYVNNADAEGDVTAHRMKVVHNLTVATGAIEYTASLKWDSTSGSWTVSGGYVELGNK